MSPIFIRPSREQSEHDRLVKFLKAKYDKKYDVETNEGDQQTLSVKIGANLHYPDLILLGDARKPVGLIEVESDHSVNNLEAMSQWVQFSRARVPFYLYVPAQSYETAKRFCDTYQARVAEIWAYRANIDGFDLMRMHHDPNAAAPATKSAKPAAASPKAKSEAKPAAKVVKPAPKPPKMPVKRGKPKPAPKKKPAPTKAKKTAKKPAKGKKR